MSSFELYLLGVRGRVHTRTQNHKVVCRCSPGLQLDSGQIRTDYSRELLRQFRSRLCPTAPVSRGLDYTLRCSVCTESPHSRLVCEPSPFRFIKLPTPWVKRPLRVRSLAADHPLYISDNFTIQWPLRHLLHSTFLKSRGCQSFRASPNNLRV